MLTHEEVCRFISDMPGLEIDAITEIEYPKKELGGYIIDCPGEDDRKMAVSQERLDLGFKFSHYISKLGGDVYRYWKQKDE